MFIKALTWFFLLPIFIVLPTLKRGVGRLLLALYRIYRLVKINLKKQLTGGTSAQTGVVYTTLVVLSMLVVLSNVQAQSLPPDSDSQSILEQLFDPIEELTIIEAGATNRAPQATSSDPQLLAALENTSDAVGLELNQNNEDLLQPVAEIGGALIKQNISGPSLKRNQVFSYTIEPGETISGIAARYGLRYHTLLWANNLSDYSLIRPGDDIKIPPGDGVLHTVKKNETLSGLATKYEIDLNEIMEANSLVSANQLSIGDELLIPGAQLIQPRSTTRLASVRSIFNPNPVKISNSGFIWPTPGRRITQYYWLGHRAIDVGGNAAQSILASKAGRVEYAGWSNGYGYNVTLDHGGGVKTRYAHLSRIFVSPGDQLAQGEELGKMGTTGRSTGVHLHFEILDGGRFLNPLSYL